MGKYIGGSGPTNAKIMIVLECPTYDDEKNEKLLSGAIGKMYQTVLKEAGIIASGCWVTAACKYVVPPNPRTGRKLPFKTRAKINNVDLEGSLHDLQEEVNTLSPNVIIGFGLHSLYSLTSKSPLDDYRGSILFGTGHKCICTYPIDYIIVDYRLKPIILFDLRRALQESDYPEVLGPNRTLRIAQNSADVYEYKEKAKSATRLGVDIEAIDCIPVCVGLSTNRNFGFTIPLWNKFGERVLSTIPDADIAITWIHLSDILNLPNLKKIGQNFKYDEDKINRFGFSIDLLSGDTMLKAQAINPEFSKALSFNQSIYTREPFYKNEGMYEGTIEDLFLGCARDACVTLEIDEEMDKDLDEIGQRKYYENFLMQLHSSYLKSETHGFKVSKEKREELIRKYIKWTEEINFRLWKLTGSYINTGSPKQISILLYNTLKLPQRAGTGEEILTALLTNVIKDEHRKEIVELILLDRRVKKTISTYLMAIPDYDGRMKTSYFLALETGRTGTTQLEPPIRPWIEVVNWNNGKKDDKPIGIAFQTLTKHGDVGQDVREMFIPDDEEEVFVNIDSSQAEARVVFNLANDEEALELIDTNDYHALTASWFFGGTEETWSKKVLGYEHPIRFAGKTLRHAGHLGAQKSTAASEVNTQARKYKIDLRITEQQADNALKIFHYRQPKIREIFHNSIIEALGKNRILIAALPYGIDAPYGGRRMFYDKWNDDLFRQAFSYIPQRTVTDNTKAAKLRIEKLVPSVKCIVESHDSLTFSIKKKDVSWFAPLAIEEFERPINFSHCTLPRRNLIIPAEVEIGTDYKNFKKYRLEDEQTIRRGNEETFNGNSSTNDKRGYEKIS